MHWLLLLIYRLLSMGQIVIIFNFIMSGIIAILHSKSVEELGWFKGCREGFGKSPSFHLPQDCYFYSAQSSSVINSKMVATAIWKQTSSFVCPKNTLAMRARCLQKKVLSFNKCLVLPPPTPCIQCWIPGNYCADMGPMFCGGRGEWLDMCGLK